MGARYLFKVQRHAPNPSMAPYQPPGMDAFYGEAVDTTQDDHGYIGFYGPPTLFDHLDTTTGQARLCAWLAKSVLEEEDTAASALVYAALLPMGPVDLRVKVEVTLESGALGWVAFDWVGKLPLHGLRHSAEAEERAITLSESLPASEPSSSKPRPKL